MIRHHTFFEALSRLPSQTPTWEVVMAGYLIMGLFDSWQRLEPIDLVSDNTGENIGRLIDGLSPRYHTEQVALQKVLQKLIEVPCMAQPSYVASSLLNYGMVLEREGRWSLAADVYRTITEAFELDARSTTVDFATAGYARRREGFCLRNITDYHGAQIAYRKAVALGARGHDKGVQWYAKIGLANMERFRGNLPEAKTAIEELLRECDRYDSDISDAIRSDILHTRGSVYSDMGLCHESMADFLTAYRISKDPIAKEHMYTDLLISTLDVVQPIKTHRALVEIATTTTVNLVRQTAIVNLIDHEAISSSEAEFAYWKDRWQPEHCDPRVNALAKLHIARGVKKFGKRQEALRAFDEAVDFATTAGVQTLRSDAMNELEAFTA